MVNALLPALLTAAGVLALAGAAKLRSPAAAAAAVAAAGVPASAGAVRILGAAEVVLAGACIVHPSAAAALLLAAVYLAFAAFVTRQLRRSGDPAPCGCFGDERAPATGWHLGLDLAAAAIGIAAALAPPSWDAVGAGGLGGGALAVGVAACVYLAYLAYTALPALWAARTVARTEGSRWPAR